MKSINNALRTALLVVALAVGAVIGWDLFTKDSELWLHYEDADPVVALGEYGSYESCSMAAHVHGGPSGCRRVDGPFGLLNRMADGFATPE